MEPPPSNHSNESDLATTTISYLTPICMSTFCLLGLYGNTVSAIIFKHPIMKSPIDILLLGLSLIDLFLIILSIPVFVFPAIDQQWDIVRDPNVLLEIYKYTTSVVYPFSMTTQTASIWTFLIISIERYLAISKPLKRHKLLTAREAKIAQISVIISAMLYNLTRFWEYQEVDTITTSTNTNTLRYHPYYFYGYYILLYQITHFLLPFLIILLLNLFIVRSLSGAPPNLRRFSRSQMQQRKTSSMIVLITIVFAVCNVGPFLLNLWEGIDPKIYLPETADRELPFLLSDISNCLVLVNSSTTFIIYLLCCRKYRLLFKFYGRFRNAPSRMLLADENNVHCALIRAMYPLRAPAVAYNLDVRSCSEDTTQHTRSESTAYSSARQDSGTRGY